MFLITKDGVKSYDSGVPEFYLKFSDIQFLAKNENGRVKLLEELDVGSVLVGNLGQEVHPKVFLTNDPEPEISEETYKREMGYYRRLY